MKIAKCHICNRWFRAERMEEVDVGDNLCIKRHICKDCLTKIDNGAGAEEPVLNV